MSFSYSEEQSTVSGAIHRVLYERGTSILFFAAASNHGANELEMFPAHHKSVFSIRATNTNRCFAEFNPPRSEHDGTVLGTLGINVPCLGMGDSGMDVHKSSTSIATAVAGGIAASILGFAKENRMDDAVGKRQGMHAVLRALAFPTLSHDCLYLVPWKLKDKSDEERVAILRAALSCYGRC